MIAGRSATIEAGASSSRITVDPTDGGADELDKIGDRIHAAYLQQADTADLWHSTKQGPEPHALSGRGRRAAPE